MLVSYILVVYNISIRKTINNLEEIACAAGAVLKQQIAMPMADLTKETARVLGYMRMGTAVEKCVRLGIALAVSEGFIDEDEKGGLCCPFALLYKPKQI